MEEKVNWSGKTDHHRLKANQNAPGTVEKHLLQSWNNSWYLNIWTWATQLLNILQPKSKNQMK